MASRDDEPRTERDQTDESLRAEREKVDDALGDGRADIAQVADAAISRARARADKLLEEARARTDRQASAPGPSALLVRERATEDRVVSRERAVADEMVREERVAQASLLATERDETDQNLLTEREHSDGALATRDEFLGIVSHDLRNLLSTVIGYAALIGKLASRDGPASDVRDHARRIERAGGRMERLVGDLVDVASIEAGRLTVMPELGDPRQVVTEAVESFLAQAEAAGVALVAELAATIPLIAFDASRILQVLTNLLSNAIKFTPRGGRVVVRVERVGDEVRLVVSDTGIGIPADKLDLIFERFLQLPDPQRRGHGLGLYISKCIVEGHEGRIWAESTPGKGTRFQVALPCDAGAVRAR